MNNLEPLMTSARSGDKSKDEWQTPLWLFEKLDEEFKFDLDPAATEDNHLTWAYMTKKENGLAYNWFGSVFVNPPYSRMKEWVKKGYEEAQLPPVKRVVMLIAARTDTQAWWNFIRHGEVRFLPGRLKFEHPNGARHSAPFPSAVVIFGRDIEAKTVYWDIKEPK